MYIKIYIPEITSEDGVPYRQNTYNDVSFIIGVDQ